MLFRFPYDNHYEFCSSNFIHQILFMYLCYDRYMRNMRTASNSERAGGYESYLGCMKALQSAVEGLFVFDADPAPSPVPSNAPSSGSSEGMDISP